MTFTFKLSQRLARSRSLALVILAAALAACENTLPVSSASRSSTAPVSSVYVTPPTATPAVAQTQQFAAVLLDSVGDTLAGRVVTWTSSDTTIARVSATGLVTAKANGSATVIATSEGRSGGANLAVGGTTPPLPPPNNSKPHTGWFVAPSGSAGAAGTESQPWDLQTALSGASGRVQPGDTIWLRGGTYYGSFAASLSGTAAKPILVRQYPGERATLDGGSTGSDVLVVNGQWTVYWGFEIMESGTARYGTAGTGSGLRGDGVYVNNASNIKLINLIVHDTGHGTYTENTAHNIEIYGWLIYDGGWQDGVRSDGHGIYIKNDGNGWKVARDNVIFNQMGFGIHGYTESTGQLRNIVFDGNVVFNNGLTSSYQSNNLNMQLGGNGVADNDSVTSNMLYYSPGGSWMNARIGYNALQNGAALVKGNYIVGGSETFDVGYWQNLTVQSNTLYGTATLLVQHDGSARSTQHWSGNQHLRDPGSAAWQLGGTYTFPNWQSAAGASDQATAATPGGAQVFVRPNRYEGGRGTIVIYNWPGQGSVAVNLSSVLTVGARYEIHNVQDYFGSPVVSGTYAGGAVSVPMTGVTPPQLIGGAFTAPLRTGPFFDAFIVTSSM